MQVTTEMLKARFPRSFDESAPATEGPSWQDRRAAEREQATREDSWRVLSDRIGHRYADCTLDGFDVYEPGSQATVLAQLVNYQDEMVRRVKEIGQGLLLFGPPGTGKDHLVAALMRVAVLTHGMKVHWINGLDWFGVVRDRMDSHVSEERTIRELTSPDVLVISDPLPPVGDLSPNQMTMLFRAIDGRYRDCKPVWMTANIANRAEAEKRMGAAVYRRLRDEGLPLFCDWKPFVQRKGK